MHSILIMHFKKTLRQKMKPSFFAIRLSVEYRNLTPPSPFKKVIKLPLSMLDN